MKRFNSLRLKPYRYYLLLTIRDTIFIKLNENTFLIQKWCNGMDRGLINLCVFACLN